MAAPLGVTFYAPDRHLVYDGDTPEQRGVGGGVTARIRLAAALARLGHDVCMVCNCPRERDVDGVRYLPIDRCISIDTEVLVVQSSGGALDVRPILELDVRAKLQIGWCQGFAPVAGIGEVSPDGVVLCSEYLRARVQRDWGLDPGKLWVFHNGVEPEILGRSLRRPRRPRRELKRILYSSHPDKGLDAALAVMRSLRSRDPQWELHVFGGAELWGQQPGAILAEPGVVDHGLVGQRDLRAALPRCGFSLHLQEFEEPFGISMAQAMAAGSIPMASPVGAFPELIDHGRNGFLIAGAHTEGDTVERAARLMEAVVADPSWWASVSRQARVSTLTWAELAVAWERWFHWVLDGRPSPSSGVEVGDCPACGGDPVYFGDGYHCARCGRYARSLSRV